MLHPLEGPEVTVIKMAVAFHASHHVNTVGAFFNGAEHMNDIYLAGTRHKDDFNVGRVLQSHRTCQVRSRITSVITAKRDNDGVKIFHDVLLSGKDPTLPDLTRFLESNDVFE